MLWLILAGTGYMLAWEGNFGKGLACIFAPRILEVEIDGQQGQSGSSNPS